MKKILICFVFLSFAFLNGVAHAKETGLKKTLSGLEKIPIAYGVNHFRLDGTDIIIVRAELPSEVAGYGDIYTVIYNRKEKWELVQYPNHAFDTGTWPRTEEDAVSTAFFITTGKTGNNLKTLYLLKAKRAFKDSAADPGVATFELYSVQENGDFGFFEIQKIDTFKTEKKYGNIDCALKEELGVSLTEKSFVDSRCVDHRTP